MQVMLSVPRPSDAAKFIGHILSIIISTIFDSTTPPGVAAVGDCVAPRFEPYLFKGDTLVPALLIDLWRPKADPVPFLTGEAPAFRT
jgi:hypothetical protein